MISGVGLVASFSIPYLCIIGMVDTCLLAAILLFSSFLLPLFSVTWNMQFSRLTCNNFPRPEDLGREDLQRFRVARVPVFPGLVCTATKPKTRLLACMINMGSIINGIQFASAASSEFESIIYPRHPSVSENWTGISFACKMRASLTALHILHQFAPTMILLLSQHAHSRTGYIYDSNMQLLYLPPATLWPFAGDLLPITCPQVDTLTFPLNTPTSQATWPQSCRHR
jgi:hypothetical protein